MQTMLETPPILTKPSTCKPILVYLPVSNEAVLHGLEIRCQRIEKEVLDLVITARRLQSYFQSNQVNVWTELPIKQVLRKPNLARRMVGWTVELSEFDISFKRRGHEWFLFVDRASNQKGSGARVILEGSNNVMIDQSLHFEFKASNNQAKYKTLLVGMKLVGKLGAQVLTTKSDSFV
ncbi:hypothetical protein CR513_06021, partial [Mucuna pruriens]